MRNRVHRAAVAVGATALIAVVAGTSMRSAHGAAHTAAVPTATGGVFEAGVTPAVTLHRATVTFTVRTAVPSPTRGVPTATPAPLVPPTSAPLIMVSPSPTPTVAPVTFGVLDHQILYDNGIQLALIRPDGKGKSGLSFLSSGSGKRPRFSGTWEYLYYNNGYWLGDVYGHQRAIVPPTIPGEEVYDAIPSPDGQYIAWQMVTPGTIAGNVVNTGASRIVLSDATGGNAHTLIQQPAGTRYGDIPLLYGWRPGRPPTVLVQTNYAIPSMLGLHRGLEEFDPTILDMVNDYLPPLDQQDLPQGEVLGISASGATIVFSSHDALLPSGEGPFPVDLEVMNLAQRRIVTIDRAANHHDKITGSLPAPRAYIFARQAFVSPDDSRVAYTRLDILYPKGKDHPYVRPIACLANLDGSGQVDFGPDERVVGWTDAQTVLVRRENSHTNGLYTVNLTTGHVTRVLLGNALSVDGIVP